MMARTRAAHSRAADAAAAAAAAEGSAQNPIGIRDSNSPEASDRSTPAPTTKRATRSRGAKTCKMSTPARAGATPNRVTKAPAKTRAKPVSTPVKKDCVICAVTKQVGNTAGRGFKKIEGACEHFQNTCNTCVSRMLKQKIVMGDLEEPVMVCVFPECEHVLDFAEVGKLIYKGVRETWDDALLKHRLRKDENYMCCLQSSCGRYFSIEDCKGEIKKPGKSTKSNKATKSDISQKISCPYCEFDMCLNCVRPYHEGTCSELAAEEEKMTLKKIKDMGAKPCPRCGVNIEKNGGCNHMKCKSCKHDFCFHCLVAYEPNMQHGEGCPDGRRIAHDPANWAHDGDELRAFGRDELQALLRNDLQVFGAAMREAGERMMAAPRPAPQLLPLPRDVQQGANPAVALPPPPPPPRPAPRPAEAPQHATPTAPPRAPAPTAMPRPPPPPRTPFQRLHEFAHPGNPLGRAPGLVPNPFFQPQENAHNPQATHPALPTAHNFPPPRAGGIPHPPPLPQRVRTGLGNVINLMEWMARGQHERDNNNEDGDGAVNGRGGAAGQAFANADGNARGNVLGQGHEGGAWGQFAPEEGDWREFW